MTNHAMPDPPPNSNRAPHVHAALSAPESTRSIAAQAFKFLGLIATCAGALAVLRLMGTKEEGQRWFYALLMPLGLIAWFIGFYLSLARPENAGASSPLPPGGG